MVGDAGGKEEGGHVALTPFLGVWAGEVVLLDDPAAVEFRERALLVEGGRGRW